MAESLPSKQVVAGSSPLSPTTFQARRNTPQLTKSLSSRREGLSLRTIEFYEYCLTPFVRGYEVTSEGINSFLANLTCGNAKGNYLQN